ncbi:MAG: sugar phosphate isomerase/epimerase [Kiritimatiellae bacterium]|nr:sugar phosphate isomerase/epimerase [Kiritimatiellia bacterium]
MKTGLFLANHFYEKAGGRPAIQGLIEYGVMVGRSSLSTRELCRLTPIALKEMAGLGVECVELFNTAEKLDALASQVKELKDTCIIIHEFDDEDGYPSSNRIGGEDKQLRTVIREHLKWLIEIAGRMEAAKIVLHTPKLMLTEINPGDKSLPQRVRGLWVELLKHCAPFAARRKVILAVENEVARPHEGEWRLVRRPQDLTAAVDEVASEYVKCTFDVAHANVGFSPLDYAAILGKRISHVHWHDNDGTKDQHLAPGMGNIDFTALMKFLLALEKQGADEITVTLECDKPAVDYEGAFRALNSLRNNIAR